MPLGVIALKPVGSVTPHCPSYLLYLRATYYRPCFRCQSDAVSNLKSQMSNFKYESFCSSEIGTECIRGPVTVFTEPRDIIGARHRGSVAMCRTLHESVGCLTWPYRNKGNEREDLEEESGRGWNLIVALEALGLCSEYHVDVYESAELGYVIPGSKLPHLVKCHPKINDMVIR